MLGADQVRKLKMKATRYMLNDGNGLYIEVHPNGAKYWILRYSENGRKTSVSLGSYPEFSLKEARERRDEKKSKLARGETIKKTKINPETFEMVAREWFVLHTPDKAKTHTESIEQRLRLYLFPAFGSLKMAEIDPPMVLALLDKIAKSGKIETMHRVADIAGQIFKRAPFSKWGCCSPLICSLDPASFGTWNGAKYKQYPMNG